VTESVLFVLPSFAGGGAERVIIALANGLDRQMYTPAFLVLENKGPLAGNVDQDIVVNALDQPRLRYAIPALRRFVLQASPSVVVSTMGYLNLGMLWALGCNRDRFGVIVREANDPDVTISSLPIPALGRWLYRRYYRRANCIIAPSAVIGERLAEVVPAAADMIRLLRNPIDDVRIRQAATPLNRHPGGGVRFVAAGRLTHQKGFDRLLDWFINLPPGAHLVLLGEGPERANLESRIASLGLERRVDLAGFVSNPWPYFAGADAFLLSSRWEGMPNAALEALACGTPVIAMSQAGAVHEIAAETSPNALEIAETKEEFVTGMQKVIAAKDIVLRDSLLPLSFAPGPVGSDFHALIESVSRR
jgi:glycosyltransferase involved in cell wall biosynthesis